MATEDKSLTELLRIVTRYRNGRHSRRKMNKIALATRRKFSGKVYLVVIGLGILTSILSIPLTQSFQAAFLNKPPPTSAWLAVINGFANAVVFGGLGLLLAGRIGLGMPFVEHWARRLPAPGRFADVVAIAGIAGFGVGGSLLLLDVGVFGRALASMFERFEIDPYALQIHPVAGLLGVTSAGVSEETVFRLFVLSLLAWLGALLFADEEGRPKPGVLWTANVLAALAFGAAHLPLAMALGWPLDSMIITRALLLNGIAGLVFGWLYWSYGLESAMLAHFFTGVALYALVPLVRIQQGVPMTVVATGFAAVLVVAFLAWALRRLRFAPNDASWPGRRRNSRNGA